MSSDFVPMVKEYDLEVRREPSLILDEAKKAAIALKDVVAQKKRPVYSTENNILNLKIGRY